MHILPWRSERTREQSTDPSEPRPQGSASVEPLFRNLFSSMTKLLCISLIAAVCSAQPYTRGIGVYPGDPGQYAGPSLKIDASTYRNLALHRPAWHSSSYDFNLTAQLITDGIVETKLPRWVAVATSQHGYLKRNER